MKLKEAMAFCNNMKPNVFDEDFIIGEVNGLDGLIHQNIISRAADNTTIFTPYTKEDKEKELLVPAPYNDIYFHYLASKIDLLNGEYASYNNHASIYNTMYEDYAAYYRRNHIPK